MNIQEFETELRALIARARSGEKIALESLIDIIDTELEGLKMAEQDGETY